MPEQENIAPLGDASNAPRSHLTAGSKRPGHIIEGEAKRNTKIPLVADRRGTMASHDAVSSSGINPRRQSQYLNRRATRGGQSEAATAPGRIRPAMTYTAAKQPAQTFQRPKLAVRPPTNKENRRVTMSEHNEMNQRVGMLEKFMETSAQRTQEFDELKVKNDELRIKSAAFEARAQSAERDVVSLTSQLSEAKLELNAHQLRMQQEILGVRHEVELFRKKCEVAEADTRNIREKYNQEMEKSKELKEKNEDAELKAKFAGIEGRTKDAENERLNQENIALKQKLDISVENYEATISQLKQAASQQQQLLEKAEALKKEESLNVQKWQMEAERLARNVKEIEEKLQTVTFNSELQEKQLRNELMACNAQLSETRALAESCSADTATVVSREKALQRQVEELHGQIEELKRRSSLSSGEASKLLDEKNQAEHRMREQRDVIDKTLRALAEEKERTRKLQAEAAEQAKTVAALEAKAREDQVMRRALHNQVMELKGNIRVFCRVRPFIGGEMGANKDPSFRLKGEQKIIAVPPKSGRSDDNLSFKYDFVFGPQAGQGTVFEEISQLVQSALDGYRVCIFAYGQTGSGKTHTMIGGQDEEALGMIPRSVRQVFDAADEMSADGWDFAFRVSFIEIYNENCRDLLATGSRSLEVKINPTTKAVDVPNLTVEHAVDTEQILRLLARANANRATAATEANVRSSRSHSVFQLEIDGVHEESGQTLRGALNLVDLAGSERLDVSKAEGKRLKETQHINKSLSALADVIMALSNKAKHIPYRNSKLTTLLSDSLGGDSKTLMFVNVSPVEASYQESVCSLRFAMRVNQCHIGTAKRNNRVENRQ